jgi:hypothetical protein
MHSQDIANHQLQTLRPFLLRTSGQFELKAFKNRRDSECSLDATREWLQNAHVELLKRDATLGPNSFNYATLSRNQQTYLSVIYGLVDLVFDSSLPSSPTTPLSLSSSPVKEAATPTTTTPRIFGPPETLYLDHGRLSLLHTDTDDALAMHLFLLLYRQLTLSSSSSGKNLQAADLATMKSEIRDIALGRLAYCIGRDHSLPSPSSSSNSHSRDDRFHSEKENIQDIVLQIAHRAQEAKQPRSSSERQLSFFHAPDEALIKLAQRWSDSNLRTDSPLAILSRRRLRDTVFQAVVAMVYPARGTSHPHNQLATLESLAPSTPAKNSVAGKLVLPSGIITPELEPLKEEICTLVGKISRLVLIHLDTYLPLYEQANFLQ